MSSIDSTFIIKDVIQVGVQMYECMETGIEDNTIQWGKGFWLEIVVRIMQWGQCSEDNAVRIMQWLISVSGKFIYKKDRKSVV